VKTFRGDLLKLYSLLKNKEDFAFTRFSDGEEFILKNNYLEINDSKVIAGEQTFNKGYSNLDHKLFDPNKHQWFRERLFKSFMHTEKNYFKGICCSCCVGEERHKWFRDILNEDENLTWANLLVNFNYDAFLHLFIPEFKLRNVILICNKTADISNLPFKVIKDFRVGDNCNINNISIVDEIKLYYKNNNIQNTILLSSASSLSNIIIYELYKEFKNNTYINIGTTLNHLLKLSIDRDYLLARHQFHQEYGLSHRNCIW